MSKVYFKVEGNVVVKYIPVRENDYKAEAIMPKEIFKSVIKSGLIQE